MTVLGLIKLASAIVIPTGVGSVAKQIVAPTLKNMTKIEKVCAIAATSAVGTYIADKATEHFHEELDELHDKLVKGKQTPEKEVIGDAGSD